MFSLVDQLVPMTQLQKLSTLICILAITFSCTQSEYPELVIVNANVYTATAQIPETRSEFGIAINDGIITNIDESDIIKNMAGENTKVLDADGQFLMPGFIEAHGHFMGIGQQLINVNLMQTNNWDEVVALVDEKVKTTEKGAWIVGRGWHQEKWNRQPEESHYGYPTHHSISNITKEHPVLLKHASGHSLFANAMAMKLAGIDLETPNPVGGQIIRTSQGEAIGVFEERAMESIEHAYETYRNSLSEKELKDEWLAIMALAQKECIEKGITSFQDAGTEIRYLDDMEQYAKDDSLRLRLWVMGRDSLKNLQKSISKHRVVGLGDHHYTCRAIKSEVDGALGAFGAWLLKPYHDKTDFKGQNTTDIKEVAAIADLALKNNMQLCVHAIGDRANRVVLDIFEAKLADIDSNVVNPRWRIEHAQHLNTADIPRFKEMGAIASMQGIHCTSDAPFVEKRLGTQRAKEGAYAWRSLLDAGVLIANGTDAPVEDVDPIKNFYATVTRKRADNGMSFFPEQAMSRNEALKSYTIWNAYAAFEEDLKGSIEVGKLADFVILNKDLLSCHDDEILNTEILYTIIDGEIQYEK